MCFETTKSARAKIAKTDIECWKFLNPNKSPYFTGCHNIKTPYKIGELTSKIKLHITDTFRGAEINLGYHSYKTKKECADMRNHWARSYNKGIVKKFIIPAGARYYENETEYVSESIMLVK